MHVYPHIKETVWDELKPPVSKPTIFNAGFETTSFRSIKIKIKYSFVKDKPVMYFLLVDDLTGELIKYVPCQESPLLQASLKVLAP